MGTQLSQLGLRFDAIVLDFDGVLVESVHVKTQAFAVLYEPYGPDVVAKVVAWHVAHGGVSRFEKFRYFHRHFLGRDLPSDAEADLGARFSALVEDAVVASPRVSGAMEFLKRHCRKVPLHVASGTPDDELKRIVRRCGMEQFFVSVHGSPARKADILHGLIEQRGYHRARLLMVGDAMTDYEGAFAVGVPFIGRVAQGMANPFPPGVQIVPDLRHLSKVR